MAPKRKSASESEATPKSKRQSMSTRSTKKVTTPSSKSPKNSSSNGKSKSPAIVDTAAAKAKESKSKTSPISTTPPAARGRGRPRKSELIANSPEAVVALPKPLIPGAIDVTTSEASKASVRRTMNSPKTDDEVISIWNQCWSAMFICMMTIGPVFLTITLISYTASKITSSQAIASVGVIYTYIYLVIMGSYIVAILPFIVMSRLFTSLVSGSADTTVNIRVLMLVCLVLWMVTCQYGS